MNNLLSNYFLLAFRSFNKNKFSVSVSILGMSIAFACAIVAWFNYELNANFDSQHVNAENIYRINFKHESGQKEYHYGINPIPMGGLIKENFRESVTVIRYETNDLQVKINNELFESFGAFADPEFLEVFTIKLSPGSSRDISGNNILISDEIATKYFGSRDPIGKSISILVNDQPKEFRISGIFPAFGFNNSFRFGMLTNLDNFFITVSDKLIAPDNWKRWNTTFLYFTDPSQVSTVTRSLSRYIPAQNEARPDLKVNEFYLDPFVGMAARSRTMQIRGHWFGQPLPPAAVIVLFVVSAVLLLVACVNMTNTSIAIAGRRLKEIGLRKVMGGRVKDLRFQFFNESFLLCLLSLVLGFVVAEALLPAWDAIWPDIEFHATYLGNWSFIAFIAATLIICATVSGCYPALYISSFHPNEILKGKVKFGGSGLFTRILLVFQLSVSVMAIIFNVAFFQNSKYQENFDLGFNYENIIQIPVRDGKEYELVKNSLLEDKRVMSLSGSQHHIFTSSYKGTLRNGVTEKEVDMLNIGDDYFTTLNIRMLEGRGFRIGSISDQNESVIVNEEFVKAFNLGSKPVGQRLFFNDTVQLYVVGVVRDVYLNSLFQPVQPLAFRYTDPASYRFLTVSAAGSDLSAINQSAESYWKTINPNRLYQGKLMNEEMARTLLHFQNVSLLYSFLGIVIIVLAIAGLISIVSIHIQKKLLEVGLRKIMGAGVVHLAFLIGRPVMVVVGFSAVFGSAMGIFAANKFLDSVWEYYQATQIEVVVFSIGLMAFVVSAAVLYRIIRATMINPVHVLKEE